MTLLDRTTQILTVVSKRRLFLCSSPSLARKPPKEEYENNIFHTRKRTSEPFDRRWKWTPKSAEPYNKRGGNIEWTKMTFLHRGVQMPGYLDPKTKEFVFVKEMVPEIVVPNLENCKLKPYVSYNAPNIKNEEFDAKQLYEKTLQSEVISKFQQEAVEKIKKK